MIWLILAVIVLAILLVLSVIWGFKQRKKPKQIQKNLDIILDHSITDTKVKAIQNTIKKKFIEGKNEKESDAAIKHIFSVINNSKL